MGATTGAVLAVVLCLSLLPLALYLTREARTPEQCPAPRGSPDLEAP
jgi:hypothetical protein